MTNAKVILDSDVLSALFRRHTIVSHHAMLYQKRFGKFTISALTRFEVLRGLKASDAVRQISAFDLFCEKNEILPLTDPIIVCATDIYAELKRNGDLIDDADILIAATALTHKLALATNNEKHFRRVSGLRIENWMKE